MAPRVVLFDLDDTLFRHTESVAAGVLAHRRTHRGPLAEADDGTEFARWHELEELHYNRYLRGEVGFLDQRRARVRAFVEPYGLDLTDDEAADRWFGAYLAEYRRAWKLHDDALPALDRLQEVIAGVRFGIVTNAVIAFQMQKLDALGLSNRMEHVVASAELGVAKPDPRIFWHACELFAVKPEDAVYIGDRLDTDAVGAAGARLRGVWLDRASGTSTGDRAAAEAAGIDIVGTLTELPVLLAP